MSHLTFLDLPGEIRNQIYRLLLIVPSPSTKRVLGSDPAIYPQILCVCRKVHKEASEILYGANTFLAHPNLLSGLPRLRPYYETISSKRLISLIRRYHFRVRLDNDPNFSAERAEESFDSVEELTVEVFQAQYGSSDHKVLELLEGVRGVKKARVYGSVVAFPEYAKWLENAMMSPKDADVVRFEDIGSEEVRNFDLWTVSAEPEPAENTASSHIV